MEFLKNSSNEIRTHEIHIRREPPLVTIKSTVKISSIFVAFLENMNFTINENHLQPSHAVYMAKWLQLYRQGHFYQKETSKSTLTVYSIYYL